VTDELVNVRYMADDVEEAVAFHTTHFGFTVRSNDASAFPDVVRGHLQLRRLAWASVRGCPLLGAERPLWRPASCLGLKPGCD
jgi:hypothetical protein